MLVVIEARSWVHAHMTYLLSSISDAQNGLTILDSDRMLPPRAWQGLDTEI
jgi:hypothetical protein